LPFYEPFYQFMHPQFLAKEVEKAHGCGAGIFSILHIEPEHNNDFRKVASPELKKLDHSSTGIWKMLIKPRKIRLNSTVALFRNRSFTCGEFQE
jgi:hypothetical protein